MYLWKLNKIEESLKERSLSEREKSVYLIIYNLFVLLPLVLYEFYPTQWMIRILIELDPYKFIHRLQGFLFIFIFVAGILFCYWNNKKGDNTHFLERFICLSVPIGFKIFLVLIVVGFILNWTFLFRLAHPKAPFYYEISRLCLNLSMEIAYFLWVGFKIKKISTPSPS